MKRRTPWVQLSLGAALLIAGVAPLAGLACAPGSPCAEMAPVTPPCQGGSGAAPALDCCGAGEVPGTQSGAEAVQPPLAPSVAAVLGPSSATLGMEGTPPRPIRTAPAVLSQGIDLFTRHASFLI